MFPLLSLRESRIGDNSSASLGGPSCYLNGVRSASQLQFGCLLSLLENVMVYTPGFCADSAKRRVALKLKCKTSGLISGSLPQSSDCHFLIKIVWWRLESIRNKQEWMKIRLPPLPETTCAGLKLISLALIVCFLENVFFCSQAKGSTSNSLLQSEYTAVSNSLLILQEREREQDFVNSMADTELFKVDAVTE